MATEGCLGTRLGSCSERNPNDSTPNKYLHRFPSLSLNGPSILPLSFGDLPAPYAMLRRFHRLSLLFPRVGQTVRNVWVNSRARLIAHTTAHRLH